MGKKQKRKRRQQARRAQQRLAKNPGVSSLLLVNPAPAPKKALAPAPSPAPLTKTDLTSALAAVVKGRTMPQRAKKPDAAAKPKRRRNKKALRAHAQPKQAAAHAAPTVQIINSPTGKTRLKPQIRHKRDGRTMPMDLNQQYKGLVPRKGPWRGKHERRGIKTLEAHKISILWNLGKGSPGAQQWVLDHIPKLNPAEDVKDTGKEVLLGLAGFFGSRIAGNMANKLPVVSRMGAAGSVGASAVVAGLAYYFLGKKWPALKKPIAVGGAIGVLDAIIKNFVTPHVPAIGGVLGDVEPALPQAKEQLALPAHSVGDSDDADASDDAEDLHARSVAAHRMLGYDNEETNNLQRRIESERQAAGMMGYGDDDDELAELRERVRMQRGMGFDVHPALAGCGCPYPPLGDDGMGFDVHPAMADYHDGMGFDVHPAMANYHDGMGFDVHPAMADYHDGMGFDVHPAMAGGADGENAMADDAMGAEGEAMADDGMGYDEQAMADSGDGLGMPTDEGQAGNDDMGPYISTDVVDNGRGAYEPSGTGAYVPQDPRVSDIPPGLSAYIPSQGMGAYVPMGGMGGADAEQIAAMLFGGPWALAALNASRRRRRHRHHGRPMHHPRHRGRWHLDPRTLRWHFFPLGDADDDAPEWTADEARRQRGVMGFDAMHMNHGHGHHRYHPHHARRHHRRHHQQPAHLECDFYLPHYAGYRHQPFHPRPAHRIPVRRVPRRAPRNWHPMTMRPPSSPMVHVPAPLPPQMQMPMQMPHAMPMQMPQAAMPRMVGPASSQPQQALSMPETGANAGGIFAPNP
jgi:hypothetical protein